MRICGAALLTLALATSAYANDTMAQLGTGGLVFVTTDTIEMASEHLFVSRDEIKVVYEFNNTLDEPQHILVAFPMPDVTGSPGSMVSIPGAYDAGTGEEAADPDNLFGFRTTFNGVPVEAELHQYAFHNNIDYSKLLSRLGVPLNPVAGATFRALNALSEDQVATLLHNGLVFNMEYDAGEGWQSDVEPLWSLRSTYSWEASFPPGRSEVIHTYRPSVGGTVAVTFMPSSAEDEWAERSLKDYTEKYCMDDSFVAAVKRTAVQSNEWTYYPFTENWISYIWSTGNNWAGPIGTFKLTIDKGFEDSLVSFCGENVKKIGPTTFEMSADDWSPPWDRELDILILDRREDVE